MLPCLTSAPAQPADCFDWRDRNHRHRPKTSQPKTMESDISIRAKGDFSIWRLQHSRPSHNAVIGAQAFVIPDQCGRLSQPPNASSAAPRGAAPASPRPTGRRHRNRQVTTPAADVDCQASGALRARNRGSWLSAFKSVVFKKKLKNTSIVRLLRRFGPDREVEHGLFPPRVQTKLWRSAHAYITGARVLVKRPRIWARNPVGLLLPRARRHA